MRISDWSSDVCSSDRELARRVVLESVGGELEIAQHAPVEKVDDVPAVDGIAGQAIGSPTGDAVGFTGLDAPQHFGEERAARCLGALRLLEHADDLDVGDRKSTRLNSSH